MKALVITGSRADRNGLEVVHEALLKAGHEALLLDAANSIKWGLPERFDVAVIGGDRSEILAVALELSLRRIPIAHIAGGDVTDGSADDRYRDAITALSDIHFATNQQAFRRLCDINERREYTRTYLTGSPAIDRIKQTPVLSKSETFRQIGLSPLPKPATSPMASDFGDPRDIETSRKLREWVQLNMVEDRYAPTALVCVHPNTSGKCAPQYEAWVTRIALSEIGIQSICLGANADSGQEAVNATWTNALEREWLTGIFAENVSPQLYYSLMTHCDVMVGNSSAMLYEAPCFGLPCVLVGDRQNGRTQPDNIWSVAAEAKAIVDAIDAALHPLVEGHFDCINPYGDGNSAPRIVKALEENEWRWTTPQPQSLIAP